MVSVMFIESSLSVSSIGVSRAAHAVQKTLDEQVKLRNPFRKHHLLTRNVKNHIKTYGVSVLRKPTPVYTGETARYHEDGCVTTVEALRSKNLCSAKELQGIRKPLFRALQWGWVYLIVDAGVAMVDGVLQAVVRSTRRQTSLSLPCVVYAALIESRCAWLSRACLVVMQHAVCRKGTRLSSARASRRSSLGAVHVSGLRRPPASNTMSTSSTTA